MASPPPKLPFFLLLLLTTISPSPISSFSIGVNYGTLGDNLPSPSTVAAFLRDHTYIDKIKIFDANPEILKAFANTGISVAVAIPDDQIRILANNPSAASSWVTEHISPFVPATNITLISLGNEVLAYNDPSLSSQLVPAMSSLHSALVAAGLPRVRVASPSSLGILAVSKPPSAAVFRKFYIEYFTPMLEFHRKTNSPFMVNPYPYFGYGPTTLEYALFKPNAGILDPGTGKLYMNMFDAMLDAVHAAMKKLGYEDVDILVGETGWPSVAEVNQPGVSVEDAMQYNKNLIKKVNSDEGTPMMPGKKFETYVFSLFNENLKPGPTAERNFGLFWPDFTPVYDSGVLRPSDGKGNGVIPTPAVPVQAPAGPVQPTPTTPTPAPSDGSGGDAGSATPQPQTSHKWCMPRVEVSDEKLQDNINYACSIGKVDCSKIEEGGECYEPNTLQAHAAFAMNSFYQSAGYNDSSCDFNGTGVLTTTDPSYAWAKTLTNGNLAPIAPKSSSPPKFYLHFVLLYFFPLLWSFLFISY